MASGSGELSSAEPLYTSRIANARVKPSASSGCWASALSRSKDVERSRTAFLLSFTWKMAESSGYPHDVADLHLPSPLAHHFTQKRLPKVRLEQRGRCHP